MKTWPSRTYTVIHFPSPFSRIRSRPLNADSLHQPRFAQHIGDRSRAIVTRIGRAGHGPRPICRACFAGGCRPRSRASRRRGHAGGVGDPALEHGGFAAFKMIRNRLPGLHLARAGNEEAAERHQEGEQKSQEISWREFFQISLREANYFTSLTIRNSTTCCQRPGPVAQRIFDASPSSAKVWSCPRAQTTGRSRSPLPLGGSPPAPFHATREMTFLDPVAGEHHRAAETSPAIRHARHFGDQAARCSWHGSPPRPRSWMTRPPARHPGVDLEAGIVGQHPASILALIPTALSRAFSRRCCRFLRSSENRGMPWRPAPGNGLPGSPRFRRSCGHFAWQ